MNNDLHKPVEDLWCIHDNRGKRVEFRDVIRVFVFVSGKIITEATQNTTQVLKNVMRLWVEISGCRFPFRILCIGVMPVKASPHQVHAFTDILFSGKGAVNDATEIGTLSMKVLSNTKKETPGITRNFLVHNTESTWLAAYLFLQGEQCCLCAVYREAQCSSKLSVSSEWRNRGCGQHNF